METGVKCRVRARSITDSPHYFRRRARMACVDRWKTPTYHAIPGCPTNGSALISSSKYRRIEFVVYSSLNYLYALKLVRSFQRIFQPVVFSFFLLTTHCELWHGLMHPLVRFGTRRDTSQSVGTYHTEVRDCSLQLQ